MTLNSYKIVLLNTLKIPKLTIFLTLSFLSLTISCVSKKNNEMKVDEKFDIQIVYSRKEQSKDSNGTEIRISLSDKTLRYRESHWGFKASNRITKKECEIDEAFLLYINNFIDNHLPQKNYTEEIRTEKQRNFTIFKYELLMNKNGKYYKIGINTNDQSTDNKYYNNLDDLFSELKFKIKI